MKLREIVVEEAVLPALAATARDDAVREMIDALVKARVISASMRDEFVKAIIDREDRSTTGLGHGVAIPHVKHKSVKQLRVAIAVSHGGVDFRALDKKPVHSIFLLLSPADRPDEHIDAMQLIFRNLNDATFRAFLRQARTAEEVLTLLVEADEKQLGH